MEAGMSGEYDLEGVVVQIIASATALAFYGGMIFGLIKIATGA
jgi:hypothetical protein